MSKVVLNKNFVNKYFYRYIHNTIVPDNNVVNDNYSSGGIGSKYSFSTDAQRVDGSNGIIDSTLYRVQVVDYYTNLTNYTGGVISSSGYLFGTIPVSRTTANSQFHFVTSSFLDIIDSINEAEYNGLFDDIQVPDFYAKGWDVNTATGVLNRINLRRIFSNLFSRNKTYRDYILNFLVSQGIITQEQVDKADCSTPVDNYDVNYINWTYDDVNDNWIMEYINPLKLTRSYRDDMNVGDEKLFLLFVPYSTNGLVDHSVKHDVMNTTRTGSNATLPYTDINGNIVIYHSFRYSQYITDSSDSTPPKPVSDFYSKTLDKNVRQCTYFASEIGLIDSGADLEYDHLDKVDYIDNIKMVFKIPYTIE